MIKLQGFDSTQGQVDFLRLHVQTGYVSHRMVTALIPGVKQAERETNFRLLPMLTFEAQ
jgi:hypothetical protein